MKLVHATAAGALVVAVPVSVYVCRSARAQDLQRRFRMNIANRNARAVFADRMTTLPRRYRKSVKAYVCRYPLELESFDEYGKMPRLQYLTLLAHHFYQISAIREYAFKLADIGNTDKALEMLDLAENSDQEMQGVLELLRHSDLNIERFRRLVRV